MWNYGGIGMMHGGMMGFGIIFFILQLLFLVAIIYLVFVAIKKLNVKGEGSSKDDNSLQILKERYAKGEISEEEYKKMKDILKD